MTASTARTASQTQDNDVSEHRSVAIMPADKELTTQQAADILGISRPTVVKLIKDGELPATVPGKVRHKIRLSDLRDCQRRLYERRKAFIAESSEAYADLEDIADFDLEATLRQARKTKR